MTDRKLDLFALLTSLDEHDFGAWSRLSEEERKEVSPYMLLRWLSGCNDPEQLVNLGHIAAPCIFEFGKKPELALMVLAACTVNGHKRYKWTAPKTTPKASKAIDLIAAAYKMPRKHAVDVLPMFSKEEIVELAEAQGWQKDEIKELK